MCYCIVAVYTICLLVLLLCRPGMSSYCLYRLSFLTWGIRDLSQLRLNLEVLQLLCRGIAHSPYFIRQYRFWLPTVRVGCRCGGLHYLISESIGSDKRCLSDKIRTPHFTSLIHVLLAYRPKCLTNKPINISHKNEVTQTMCLNGYNLFNTTQG
jgi:hypothetical protein